MKLKDLINNIDKSDQNSAGMYDDEFVQEVLDIYHNIDYDRLGERFTRYWVEVWYCTDTWVGISAIFLDDKFIALSAKTSRKGGTTYEWYSQDSYDWARAVMLSMIEYPKRDPKILTIAELESEQGDGYHVTYSSEIIGTHLIYDQKLVEFVPERLDYNQPVNEWTKVTIKVDGALMRVKTSEVLVPYRLAD